MITCDYSGLAGFYERWSTGDKAYMPVENFYLDYLSAFNGVFVELGIGTGRIAVPLSRRPGVTVYGIDSCEEMLKQCQLKMNTDSKLKLICGDFVNFSLPEKADIIYMPFRTIGHILLKKELESFFDNVYINLKQNGLFIFDHYMFDKEWAINHNDIDLPMYENDNICIIDKYMYDFESKIMHCEIRSNDKIAAHFDFRWIDVSEIEDIYSRHKFSCVTMFGDFDKSKWTPKSPNQIWVLRKID